MDGSVNITVWNDDEINKHERGPRARETIIRLVQGEESGWQEVVVDKLGTGKYINRRRDYIHKLLVDVFGAIDGDDIEFPMEELSGKILDLDNLPPEVLALDPDNPIRAYLLSIATPEEREEAQRIYAEDERRRREQAEPDGRKNKKKKQSKRSSPTKPKRR